MTDETLALKAYRLIKRDILKGSIQLDTALSERALSARYGISRTPLRTAVWRLQHEGVISRLNDGTLLLRSVSAEQFLEIVDLRRMLEGAAAARAAEKGPTETLRRLRGFLQGLTEGRRATFEEFWTHDDRFHRGVAKAAGLNLLCDILDEQRTTAKRCSIARRSGRFADQGREHLAVLNAIEGRDAGAARSAMIQHFDKVRARFLSSLWPPEAATTLTPPQSLSSR